MMKRSNYNIRVPAAGDELFPYLCPGGEPSVIPRSKMAGKRISFFFGLLTALLSSAGLYGQAELKINGLYALGGVADVSVEVPVSRHLSLAGELLYSPWQSIRLGGHSRPENFGYVMGQARWYFKDRYAWTDGPAAHRGWWIGGDIGALVMMKMSRPYFFQDGQLICWRNKYEKGAGFMAGLTVGYKWVLSRHFSLEAYAGGTFVAGWYNGYYLYDVVDGTGVVHRKDEIIMRPHRPDEPEMDDPWNGSSNWIPRLGVNVAYRFL